MITSIEELATFVLRNYPEMEDVSITTLMNMLDEVYNMGYEEGSSDGYDEGYSDCINNHDYPDED